MMSVADFWQYAGVLGALVVSAFGAPIPEELPIATGGVMVGRAWNDPESGLRWWVMLPLCIIGVVLCDSILYGVGRKWGPFISSRKWVQRWVLPPSRMEKVKKNFDDYGIWILFTARLLPGFRTPIFMTAGMIRMPAGKFLMADALYALPGVNLIFWLAYFLTDQFLEILHKVEGYRAVILVAIISFIFGFITAELLRRRGSSTGDPKEFPIIGKQLAQIGHQLHESHKQSDGSSPGTVETRPNLNPNGDPNPPESQASPSVAVR